MPRYRYLSVVGLCLSMTSRDCFDSLRTTAFPVRTCWSTTDSTTPVKLWGRMNGEAMCPLNSCRNPFMVHPITINLVVWQDPKFCQSSPRYFKYFYCSICARRSKQTCTASGYLVTLTSCEITGCCIKYAKIRNIMALMASTLFPNQFNKFIL